MPRTRTLQYPNQISFFEETIDGYMQSSIWYKTSSGLTTNDHTDIWPIDNTFTTAGPSDNVRPTNMMFKCMPYIINIPIESNSRMYCTKMMMRVVDFLNETIVVPVDIPTADSGIDIWIKIKRRVRQYSVHIKNKKKYQFCHAFYGLWNLIIQNKKWKKPI